MTDRTNPLFGAARATGATSTGAPTNLDDYVHWINAREHRNGVWVIGLTNGKRSLVWQGESGSRDWLREKGLLPNIGRTA